MVLMVEEKKSSSGKIIGVLLSLAVLGILSYAFYWYFSQPKCKIPVEYSVGTVDSRFQIDEKSFVTVSKSAAERWNGQTKIDLFKYDDSSILKLNMVYDSRQATIDELNGQASNLQGQKSSLDNQNAEFEALLQDYKNRLSKYNSEVEYYNAHGGAPPEQYAELNQEQKNLKQMQQTLNEMAANLNRQADLYNADVNTLQQDIDQNANKIITEGEYDPNSDTVNIYTYGDKGELQFVVMHELGHSLGLDHILDQGALMNAMVRSQNVDNPTLTQDDLSELERVCNFDHKFRMPSLQDLRRLIFGAVKQT